MYHLELLKVRQASQSVLPSMCLEELPTRALSSSEAFEGLLRQAEQRYEQQGGVLRDESPYYCCLLYKAVQSRSLYVKAIYMRFTFLTISDYIYTVCIVYMWYVWVDLYIAVYMVF